jgi:hypothetical protein
VHWISEVHHSLKRYRNNEHGCNIIIDRNTNFTYVNNYSSETGNQTGKLTDALYVGSYCDVLQAFLRASTISERTELTRGH